MRMLRFGFCEWKVKVKIQICAEILMLRFRLGAWKDITKVQALGMKSKFWVRLKDCLGTGKRQTESGLELKPGSPGSGLSPTSDRLGSDIAWKMNQQEKSTDWNDNA